MARMEKQYELDGMVGYRNGCGRGLHVRSSTFLGGVAPDEIEVVGECVVRPIYRFRRGDEEVEVRGVPVDLS